MSAGDLATEFVELDNVNNGIRMRPDGQVRVEKGTYIRERHEVKTTTWDVIYVNKGWERRMYYCRERLVGLCEGRVLGEQRRGRAIFT